jgi:Ribosomal protein L5
MARLQEFYRSKVVADLQAKFGYKSVMEVPRITKITLTWVCLKRLLTRKSSSTLFPI